MKKRVLLLAVSCKNGGLCPGGIDVDNPSNWIRIVRDDGQAGAVQGIDIDFAKPLDFIEFDGEPRPMGKQKENWVIKNHSCVLLKTAPKELVEKLLEEVYKCYSYHGFWKNRMGYMNEKEFEEIDDPSESIMKVQDLRIYKNQYGKVKIDFRGPNILLGFYQGISLTDQSYYDQVDSDKVVTINEAYIVVSIPKECDWVHPVTGEKLAYKFVSKVFEI